MNAPRVYKHSPWNFVIPILLFVFLLIGFTASAMNADLAGGLPMLGVFGVIILISSFSFTVKTLVSEDEISSQNLLWTKTLRWSEITRVSGSGYAIKLHNFDGDVTVAPSPHLPGYEEVVEWIGVKRPDLFNPQEYGEMSRGLMGILAQSFIGLVVIGFGVFVYFDSNEFIFPFVFAFVIGLVIIGMTLFAPQSISIQGNSIVIGYLFTQKTLPADEIASVGLGYTKTRNGKNYYVQIAQKHGGNIRISSLKPNLPVAYLVLKNWHKKNFGTRQTIQPN